MIQHFIKHWRLWFTKHATGNADSLIKIDRRVHQIDLRFAKGTAQSRMSRFAPDRLVVPYTRTMLATLLLVPQPKKIAIVGLGGGSQAKFLYKHLSNAQIDIFESDSEVIAVRDAFAIPKDDHRFSVVHADAAIALAERKDHYDLLLVDGYDANGIPPALSTQQFYHDCRACLRKGGAMATNLYSTDHKTHFQRMKSAFAASNVAMLEEIKQSNRVAFAWVAPLTRDRPMSLSTSGQRELRREIARIQAIKLFDSTK